MNFFDDQAAFDDTFGTRPMLLGNGPTKLDNKDTRKKISGYADTCMLNVFLE